MGKIPTLLSKDEKRIQRLEKESKKENRYTQNNFVIRKINFDNFFNKDTNWVNTKSIIYTLVGLGSGEALEGDVEESNLKDEDEESDDEDDDPGGNLLSK